jgi:hypothetical protein
MKRFLTTLLSFVLLISTTSFQTGDVLCDVKALKEKAKEAINSLF